MHGRGLVNTSYMQQLGSQPEVLAPALLRTAKDEAGSASCMLQCRSMGTSSPAPNAAASESAYALARLVRGIC